MERELLITGMGGQGVQLAAQVIARGATLEGRHVMLFGVYGGAMRGMNTDGTVVVGDAPLQAPPLVSHTWSAVAMHDKFWAPVAPKVRTGGLALVNVHPDYMSFGPAKGRHEYDAGLYRALLQYVRNRYDGRCWFALPREVANYVRRFQDVESDVESDREVGIAAASAQGPLA